MQGREEQKDEAEAAERAEEAEGEPCIYQCALTYFEPVCGSDGTTYINLCLLNLAICQWRKSGRQLAFWSYGPCPMRPPLEATAAAVTVKITDNGMRSSACPEECPFNLSPICASNGHIYANPCVLETAICEAAEDGIVLERALNDDICDENHT